MDQFLFRSGQVTSYLALFAVLPSFFICKMDLFAQRRQLKSIQFNYLLILFITANLWLSYFRRASQMDTTILEIQQVRVLVSAGYLIVYLCICVKSSATKRKLLMKRVVMGSLVVLSCELILKS